MHGNGSKPTECVLFAASHDFGRTFLFYSSIRSHGHSAARWQAYGCTYLYWSVCRYNKANVAHTRRGFTGAKHTRCTHTMKPFASVYNCTPFRLTSFATQARTLNVCEELHQHIQRNMNDVQSSLSIACPVLCTYCSTASTMACACVGGVFERRVHR